jgi:hypothetical protein
LILWKQKRLKSNALRAAEAINTEDIWVLECFSDLLSHYKHLISKPYLAQPIGNKNYRGN